VLPLVRQHRPDVVLMDIRMRSWTGWPPRAAAGLPDAPEVIMLTTFDADEHVLRALRAGAAASCSRTPTADIVAAVCRVARGQRCCRPRSPGG